MYEVPDRSEYSTRVMAIAIAALLVTTHATIGAIILLAPYAPFELEVFSGFLKEYNYLPAFVIFSVFSPVFIGVRRLTGQKVPIGWELHKLCIATSSGLVLGFLIVNGFSMTIRYLT